jgi:hypothetical protein
MEDRDMDKTETALEHMQERLERFIDTGSLAGVLEIIEGICHAKADHLRASWQDESAARSWEQAAKVIERAANHRHIVVTGG